MSWENTFRHYPIRRRNTEGGSPISFGASRKVYPYINFQFEEMNIDGKRIVILHIPAAQSVPTEFNKERYIRIGSSKELLRKYPQKEAALWIKLQNIEKTIITTEAPKQKLTFSKLLVYYMAKGLELKETTFADNLNFYVPQYKEIQSSCFSYGG